MRSYLAMMALLAALGWEVEAQAQQPAPTGSTWVGPDGRTYYVPPGDPAAVRAEEKREQEREQLVQKRRKAKGPPHSVGMAVAGGISIGLGSIALFGGIFGYFADRRCSSSFIIGTNCTGHEEILLISLAGLVTATAVGTPLLVVGLRRRPLNEKPEPPAEEPTVSFTVGPVSSLSLKF